MDQAGAAQDHRVTAALIVREGRLLIAQRPPGKRFALSWEFPGGKVEPGETLEESLAREIEEELCLDIQVGNLFKRILHRYEDFVIDLYAYWCEIIGGKICLQEHVAYRWALPGELKVFGLTQADRQLVPFLEKLAELPGK